MSWFSIGARFGLSFWSALPLLMKLAAVLGFITTLAIAYLAWERRIYNQGYRAGEQHVQEQWDRALEAEIKQGEAHERDARRDVEHDTPDGVRRDSWNRDHR